MRVLKQLVLGSAVLAVGWCESAPAVAGELPAVEVTEQLLAPAPDIKPAPPPNRRPPTRKRRRKKNRSRLAQLKEPRRQTPGVSGRHLGRALGGPGLG